MDLTSIDGIDVITAQTILSEIGTDISKFKTEGHFASWLGLTPAKDITGGKIIGPWAEEVQNRVAKALRMAATTLLESKTYLGARYRHLRQQLPSYAAAYRGRLSKAKEPSVNCHVLVQTHQWLRSSEQSIHPKWRHDSRAAQ